MKYLPIEKKYLMRNLKNDQIEEHAIRIIRLVFVFFTVFWGMGIKPSFAEGLVIFGPHETKIDGSIPYSVIGKYKAHFRVFKGKITLDDRLERIESVALEIKVGSITSNCPWCDKVVCSRRLLNTHEYPNIIFKSNKIIHDEDGFKVRGILEMHGIKKLMVFPFSVGISNSHKHRERLLDIHGVWVINRKDFNITWNKFLDHGGVLVGDNLTVKWGIKALIKREAL